MKAELDKCNLLVNNNQEILQIEIGNKTVTERKYKTFWAVKIEDDHELNFN